MCVLHMADIKTALQDFNPWWKGTFTIEYKPRELYAQLQKYLPLPQIIALTGLRRVGKTTLLHKFIKDYLERGVSPTNILYFSFDEFREIELRKVLQITSELTRVDFISAEGIIFFDEIQKVGRWEEQLKSLYDLTGKRVKIFISGSESLFLKKKLKETLAGRIFEFKVDPLSFKEFLCFKGLSFEPPALYEPELRQLFWEYTLTQGFPELISITDKEIIKKYIQESIIDKIIYKDIPALFKVKDGSVLSSLLNIFMYQPGQIIEISHLAKEIGLSRDTVSKYLTYLENSFLLRKLYNFSQSRRKVERKLKKYYPTVLAIDLLFKDDDLSRSLIFEWLVVTQQRAEFFWRDSYKHEVDMIIANGTIVPIEIKYGKVDLKGIIFFMDKYKLEHGKIITSYQQEEKEINGKKITLIPAHIYFL